MEHQGLTQQQARQRLDDVGKNRIETHEISSLDALIARQFLTFINAILFVAALFSFIIHNTTDGIFILTIIIVNALFGFFQEYRAQQSLEKLKHFTTPSARVIRDGHQMQISAEELVPGDIVVLSEGSRIPADGKLLEATHLEIDESILTGESIAAIKKYNDAVFLGTLVFKGRGILLIEKTGKATRFGQIAQTLSVIQPDTPPLQKTLDHMGKVLAIFPLIVGCGIILLGFLQGQSIVPLALVAISISVAAIPEGLPAVVTIAFAIGTHRMAKQGAIVRKMIAIETLGAIQVILVDKTGTITKNDMSVKHYWLREKANLPYLLDACILGNTASLAQEQKNKFDIIGDPTDGALLLWAKQHEKYNELPNDEQVFDEYVFDTETKTITTVWKKDNKKYVFVRGAPETLLNKSNLPQKEKREIAHKVALFANQGLRVIGFAYKTENHSGKPNRKHLEQGLTFLGFVGLSDPPREEVKEAIIKCRNAGIHVIMVTGDNELTALSLAKEVGLIEENETVVNAEVLKTLSDEELATLILKTRVFARTQPEDKLRLVNVLKQQNIIVGVTGDGVNDALALKKADVGVAMGKEGTDVAKEAADIILTDDNFATLVKAIEEGRVIYKNIINAILYLLSGNLAEISLIVFAVLLQLPFPLLPTQILWINLVTDSLPAIALAIGSRDMSVLFKKPRNPSDPILTAYRLFIISFIGFSLSVALLIIFYLLLQITPEAQARTIIFTLMIYAQIIVVVILGRHSLRRGNLFFIGTILFIILLQTLITFSPFFQGIFHLQI